jgi:hypothetical protein
LHIADEEAAAMSRLPNQPLLARPVASFCFSLLSGPACLTRIVDHIERHTNIYELLLPP